MKVSRSTYIIVTLIFIFCTQVIGIYSKHKVTTFNSSVTSQKGVTDELIKAMFIEDILLVMNGYYIEYFPNGIVVSNYNVKIKNIYKDDNTIFITFAASAEIGAHVSVSDDEITYSVDASGFVWLYSFKHIKIYKLPEHLKSQQIKPLPKINSLKKRGDHIVMFLFLRKKLKVLYFA